LAVPRPPGLAIPTKQHIRSPLQLPRRHYGFDEVNRRGRLGDLGVVCRSILSSVQGPARPSPASATFGRAIRCGHAITSPRLAAGGNWIRAVGSPAGWLLGVWYRHACPVDPDWAPAWCAPHSAVTSEGFAADVKSETIDITHPGARATLAK
jgi:hypothetical protein